MSDNMDLCRGTGVMASAAGSPVEGEGEGQVESVRPRLGDLRSHITCVLCAGYFIDATTIVECLHTFCRSCILCHLEASSYCPVCAATIHRTKGSSSLRADRILQTLVYKMVPDLFRQEMQQRRNFYQQKPYADPELPGWAKGDATSHAPHVFTADEHVHVRLALFDADRSEEGSTEQPGTGPSADAPPVRYLRCLAGTPITVLQKFVRTKFQIPPAVQVQLIYDSQILPADISLMDLGYMYKLAQGAVASLSFRLVRRQKRPAEPTAPVPEQQPATKRHKMEDDPRDNCTFTEEESIVSTPRSEALDDTRLRREETGEESEVSRDAEDVDVCTSTTAPDDRRENASGVDADEEVLDITGSISDEKPSPVGIQERYEEMLDISKPKVEEELADTNRPKTDVEATVVSWQGTDISRHETGISRRESDVSRQEAVDSLQEVDAAWQEADVSHQEVDVSRQRTDVSRKEPDVSQQRTNVNWRGTDASCQGDSSSSQRTDVSWQHIDVSRQGPDDRRQEIDVSRQGADVSRQGADVSRQGTDIGQQETDNIRQETDISRQETDVSRQGAVEKPSDITRRQSDEVGVRKPAVLLERMFDPDDEEPSSPQIVDDLIASLDAEDSEDDGHPVPAAAAPAPTVLPAKSATPAGQLAEPVVAASERLARHQPVDPAGPTLVPPPTFSPAAEPTKGPLNGNPKRVQMDCPQSVTPADGRWKAVSPTVGSGVDGENGNRHANVVGHDSAVPGVAGNVVNGDSIVDNAVSGAANSVKTTRTEDAVRDNKLACAVSENRLLHRSAHQTGRGLPAADDAAKSARETLSLDNTASGTEPSLDNSVHSATSTPPAQCRRTTSPCGVVTSGSDAMVAKAISATVTRPNADAASARTPTSITALSAKGSETRRPSLRDTSVATSGIHEPDNNSSARESTASGKDASVATGETRPPPTDSTAAGNRAVPTKNVSVATDDTSRSSAAVANGLSRSVAECREVSRQGSPLVGREAPRSAGSLSRPVRGTKMLTATGAAVQGISAIARSVREGEVVIERVPNVFVQASTASAGKGDRSSTPHIETSASPVKIDCSVQTTPVAKNGVVGAQTPRSAASAPPKMVDTGTATAEITPAKRPASVPQRASHDGLDQAATVRRLSASDSYARRPSNEEIYGNKLFVTDSHSRKSLAQKPKESYHQRSLAGESHYRKPSTGGPHHKQLTGEHHQKKKLSADDTYPRRLSVDDPHSRKPSSVDAHPRPSSTSAAPSSMKVPASAEAVRRVTSVETPPTYKVTPAVPRPYSASVLKVPHITNKYLLNTRTPAPSKSLSKAKQHKSSKTEQEKKLKVSYSFWKNMKAAKASSGETQSTSHPAPLLKTPTSSSPASAPLDLSTHVRKTVAADSTSMLAKTPSPPPKQKPAKPKSAKAQGTQTIHSIVNSLASRQHISLTPITSVAGSSHNTSARSARAPTPRPPSPYLSSHLPMPMPLPMPEYSFAPGGLFTPPLHVNTSMASRLGYDMAMRNLLTLSHMAMAQGGMVRPHMFPMQPMFPPRPNSHDFPPMPDPSLLRQQPEVRMGAASKKASPTAGTTAPQLRTPTALASASIQHMEDLTRTVGKRADKDRHSVTVTTIPSGD